MESITIELPEFILVKNKFNGYNYLQRFSQESDKPNVTLTFQEDSKQDPRIITIKYNLKSKKENHVLYYSEEWNKHVLITGNLGYRYIGKVLVRDRKDHRMGVSFEHLQKEGLRLNHLERISRADNIREDLTPEYVAERYKYILYQLRKQ